MKADTSRGPTLVASASKEDVAAVTAGLGRHNQASTGGKMGFPSSDDSGLVFHLAVRDRHGAVAGGVSVSSVLGVMWLEVLYVSDQHRRRGLASWLVLEAERIAHQRGCIGAGTWTFNWQGPEFYPTIGYKLCGIYDGYPFGVTEHVLAKRLPDGASMGAARKGILRSQSEGYVLAEQPTDDDMRVVYRGFHEFCVRHAGEEMDCPDVSLRLVLKDGEGRVVGGIDAFPTVRNMVLEAIWVDEPFRGKGHGRRLLLETERIAKEAGCVAVSTHCLSFQAPEFFHRLGYTTYGRVDIAIDGHVEDLLIKRL